MHPNSLANLQPGKIREHLEGKEIDYRPGRTPNWLRQRMREGLEPFVERLIAKIESGDDLSTGEIAKALDILGKYSLGEKRFDLNDEELIAEVNRFTASWFKERSMPELYDSWFSGLREHFKALEGRSG